jgi:hypothetical protein
MLNEYINYLIENVNSNNIYNEIDLVLDSGAFNGSYMIGCLIYLKSMEEKNLIHINRISGCSIGSILGLCFISNKIDIAIKNGIKMMQFIRKTQDLTLLDKNFNSIIDEIISDFDVKILDNKLFITYFDIEKKKQILISKYKNKKFLKKIIRKSIHIPYLLDRKISYNNSIDGCYPFIFKERINKILFINLQSFDKMKNILVIKNEKNIFSRILTGVLDIHNFFINNKCDMCSYVNDWTISQIVLYRSRELIFTFICYFINILLILKKYIPDCIDKNIYYNKVLCIIKDIYEDILIYLTN